MSRLGLRTRVVLASTFVLACGVLAIGISINVLLSNRLNGDANAVLAARADAQATTVELRGGRVIVREGTSAEALDREAWVFAGGRAIARPHAPRAIDRAARRLASVAARTTRNAGSEIRLLAEPVRTSDGLRQYATVVVAVALAPYEDTERIARLGTLLLGLFVVLSGALIARRSVTAGLRPVAEMARRAEDYGEHDLGARFDLGPRGDELRTLAATLNGLLGRLEASLRHEQRLSAEIAHELRTPLSGVRATAELGLIEAQPASMERALNEVVASADRMESVIGALLTAARHRDAGDAICDVRAAVTDALRAVEAQASEHGITLADGDIPADLQIGADAQIVAQAINPLLENAIRHARRYVRVAAHVAGAGRVVAITVDDDGQGIPDANAEAIFQPGWQTPGGSGAGLGLALAGRLATSLGGTVRAEPADRGARFVLELPLITSGTARDQDRARRTS